MISDALSSLGERLNGPLNLEMIVLPLDIQISNAIMTFQDSALRVTQKNFDLCGTPAYMKRSKRTTDNEDFETEVLFNENEHVPEEAKVAAIKMPISSPSNLVKSNLRKSEFERLIVEIRKLSQDSQGFWRRLPFEMCDQPDPAFQVRMILKFSELIQGM